MKNNEIALYPNSLYHIYTHANGKENLFVNTQNYIFFLIKYKYFIEPIAETFAYCLMPNHLHLMIKIKDENALQKANNNFQIAKNANPDSIKEIPLDNMPVFISKTFGNLFSSYSQSLNKQQERRGSLFMPNFKRKEINTESYSIKLIHYIHNNPVHHGFTDKMEDWKYSSYNAYLANKKTQISKEEVLAWFGGKTEFIDFHKNQEVDYGMDM